MQQMKLPELVCSAGSLPALKAAVDNGADTVYFGYKNDTNARNFAGLNFDQRKPWSRKSITPIRAANTC